MSTAPPLDSPLGSSFSTGPSRADGGAPPDPLLVAEMKNEIRALVQEISELAQADIPPSEFYAAFLSRVVTAMAAVGGAIWVVDDGKLKLEYQVNLAQAKLETTPAAISQHGQLLKQTLAGNQAIVVPPRAGQGDGEAGNPSELLLVLTPLVVEKVPQAVIEIFQRPGGGPTTQRGYLRFLIQMSDLACDYLRNRRLRRLEESQTLWRQIEQFVGAAHRSLDVRATSFAIVNEGRLLAGCDRVTLALCYGRQTRIEAVSGLDSIDRRAAEVKRLADLAAAVLRTGEPFWHSASSDESPPQIDAPLQNYVDLSHAKLVAVLPIFPRTESGDENSPAPGPQKVEPLGAIIFEQLRDSRLTESLQTRAEIVAQHSAAALAHARDHSGLFLLPVWKALGRATWMLRGRALPKTLLASALLAGGIGALALVPTDFEVSARGKLQPALRREVFAQIDGVISRVPVRHGDQVAAGTVLATMTSTNLELELAELIGRQTTTQEQLAAHQRALLDNSRGGGRLSPADENRLAGEMLQLRQEADNIERELALIRQKEQQLTVVAEQPGQVVTWKVEDLLLGRPVSRGQALLTLANPDGPWELELYVPERRIKHLQAAQRLVPRSGQRPPLDVAFTLSSHPGAQFHGRVIEIEQAAEVRGDDGNTVLVRVEIDKSQLPPLHDQTTAVAKLYCGRTSVGYAWFCDLIETMQAKVLFWLPV
ncbi:MAG: HlyD family efflux transporter periplasmic adaptor subunit [Pirellulaceae bacterium]|nr:HlyD family efflux transporter periplasmic adaptor subunit [Pirellulaceae bacterium]